MSDQQEVVSSKALITHDEIFLSWPQYSPIPRDSANEAVWEQVFDDGNTLDSFCVECQSHSVFAKAGRIFYVQEHGYNLVNFKLRCSREKKHHMHVVLRMTEDQVVKIGQHPSIADLQEFDARKYSKVLGKVRYPEFKRAIGLASHGVGVGSFVYLRRVFEGLIEDAHLIAMTEASWNESDYQQQRMDERIRTLGDRLPTFLVEHRSIYGILSKGIHELTEEECLNYFPVVKAGIEAVLDAELARKQAQEKEAALSRAIGNLAGRLERSRVGKD